MAAALTEDDEKDRPGGNGPKAIEGAAARDPTATAPRDGHGADARPADATAAADADRGVDSPAQDETGYPEQGAETGPQTPNGSDPQRPDEQGRPVICVMYASVGSGHKSAAAAICEAVRDLQAAGRIGTEYDVQMLDVLDFARHRIDGDKWASGFTGATRPIYDVSWRFFLTGRILWGGGTIWSRLMFPAFNDFVGSRNVACVIATHITAANVAVGARMIMRRSYPVVCVPTDYEVEGMWPHREANLFCVATEAMAETLRPRGVPEERIAITGIPVRGGFGELPNRSAVLRRLGIPDDKLVVLVMAGASSAQPYVRFRAEMEKTFPFLRSLSKMHFVFLPGRDQRYEQGLRKLFDAMALDNTSVLGYVDDMAGLMSAADLAILKSGGLTVTECLCARLPMLLLGKAYGQEKANAVMLTSLGASMHVTTARELLSALRTLERFPEALRALAVNTSMLRRPDAAEQVVMRSLELVGTDCSTKRNFVRFYRGGRPAHAR